MEEKKGSEADDYFILFRDTNAPDPTPEVYKKRSREEDLFLADKAEYVWGYVGKLKEYQASFVQRSLDKPLEEEFKKKTGESNAGIPSKYAFEIAVRNPLDRIRKDLMKASPNLAFLSRMHHFLLHFWYYPDSDEESLQIQQILSSQPEQAGRGIYSHMHELVVPKTHRSFVQLLSVDTLVRGLKRVNYWKETGAPRRAAAIWVIETSLAPVKLTFPGFTMRLPFMTPPPLPNSPLSNARAAFESVILKDKKYIPALTEYQREILERGVTVANNIRTTYHCEYWNIENKYEAFRTNGTLEQTAQRQDSTMGMINEINKLHNRFDQIDELRDRLDKILSVDNTDNPIPATPKAEPLPAKEEKTTRTHRNAVKQPPSVDASSPQLTAMQGNQKGRKTKLRSLWVIEQAEEGLSHREIFNKWNKMTYKDRFKIAKNEEDSGQFKFPSNIGRILGNYEKSQ